jgi:hypothetical protein
MSEEVSKHSPWRMSVAPMLDWTYAPGNIVFMRLSRHV